jgi:hypothetical protein
MFAHRGSNPRKSCWAVDPPEEYSIFETSDAGDWADSDGHLWGFRDDVGSTLGTKGERLAKFPFTSSASTPWHGYPVSPASGRQSEIPPDTLVEELKAAGHLSRTLARKIQTRRA